MTFRTLFGAAMTVTIFVVASSILISACAQAQTLQYPGKPVTIISDSAAGSTPGAMLRLVADRLSRIWGQPIVPVNHPGGREPCFANCSRRCAGRLHALHADDIQLRGTAGPAPNVPIRLPQDFSAIGYVGENPLFVVAGLSLGISKFLI